MNSICQIRSQLNSDSDVINDVTKLYDVNSLKVAILKKTVTWHDMTGNVTCVIWI